MTVLCGGGTSSAQTNFGLGVAVGTGTLAALLNNVPTPQAVAIAGAIGVVNFELSTFCTTDPPAMPVFTALDYFDVLGGNGTLAQLAAVDKFRDALGNILWPTFCKCDAVPTPAAPAFPAPPANLPVVQPPQVPSGVVGSPCFTSSVNVSIAGGVNFTDQSKLLWPSGLTSDSNPANNLRDTRGSVPAQIRWEAICTPTGANPIDGAILTIRFLDAARAEISRAVSGTSFVADAIVTAVPPSNTVHIEFDDSLHNTNFLLPSTGSAVEKVTMWCAGQSLSQPQTPCCPPDPSLQAELQAIRSLVESIFAGLPHQVNSYADGVAHTGLSGNGTITLAAQVLGIRINITTDPTSLGVDVGDPNYLFDRGFIVPVVNAAPIRAESRLVYNPQMFLLPALTEQIGYSLHAGVVITITELLRGP